MHLSQLPKIFSSAVRVESEYGCWVWRGPVTPTGYPTFKRVAAWIWAYKHIHGDLPKGQYPVLESCHGPIICANPNHRVGLPIDMQTQPHRCSVCQQWHDPRDESPIVRAAPPNRPKKQTDPYAGLTPEQREVEDMFTDLD